MEPFNLLEDALGREPTERDGHRFLRSHLPAGVEARLTGLGVYELPPGESAWPYHYELLEEEWAIVVAGEVTLRTPEGERVLHPGDVVCFPPGEDGAHAFRNDGDVPARFAMPSSIPPLGSVTVYPDSRKIKVAGPGFSRMMPLGPALDYWEGEA